MRRGGLSIVFVAYWVVLVIGSACGSEEDVSAGGEGGPCYPNETCDGELECRFGVCVESDATEQGGKGEPCYPNQTCDADLECEDDLCVESEATEEGGLGQACYSDQTCNADLECEDDLCVEPEATEEGGLGQACYSDQTCNADLECEDDLCVEPENGSGPDDCAGIPSLEEASEGAFTRAISVIDDPNDPQDGTEFSAVWLDPFPGQSVQRRFRLLPDQYASIRFDTPADLAEGHNGIFVSEIMAGYNGPPRLISISSCEGDFDAANLGPGCIREGNEGFRWQAIDHSTRCVLEPDREYYLNIVYTDAEPGVPPSDIEPNCVPTSIGYCGNLYIHSYSYP